MTIRTKREDKPKLKPHINASSDRTDRDNNWTRVVNKCNCNEIAIMVNHWPS